MQQSCGSCGLNLRIAHCYKCGGYLQQLPSQVPASPSQKAPAAKIVCGTCGPVFITQALQHCLSCGHTLLKDSDHATTSDGAVSPLINPAAAPVSKPERKFSLDLSPQHYEGYLTKKTSLLKQIVQRWFVVEDHFLYQFSDRSDVRPSVVNFLGGCFVEPVNHSQENDRLEFGFEIVMSEEPRQSRFLYAAVRDNLAYHHNMHLLTVRVSPAVHV